MKKLTTLVLATVALGVSASAATITVNCSPFPIQFAGGSGSGPISCPGFTGGGTLTGASLTLYADYTFGGPATDIQLTFSIGAPAGVTWNQSSVAIDESSSRPSGNTWRSFAPDRHTTTRSRWVCCGSLDPAAMWMS